MKRNLLICRLTVAALALASTPTLAQTTGANPVNPTNPVTSNPVTGSPTSSQPTWGNSNGYGGNSGLRLSREFREWHAREVKQGFRLGVCVGQALATANPPLIISQQTQALDQSMVNAVMAAVQACRNPNPTNQPQPTQPNPPASNPPGTNPPVTAPPTASPVPSPSPAPGMVSQGYQRGFRMKLRQQQAIQSQQQ